MNLFLFSLIAIFIVLAGYLVFLWWHPRRRSRFQVRLSTIFLLFSLIPTVPLIFLTSILATNTADVLLVPEVETAMLKAVAALKAQCEEAGKRFAEALQSDPVPEVFLRLGLDYYFVWQEEDGKILLHKSHARDDTARQHGMLFHEQRVREIWGQTGSEVEPAQAQTGVTTAGHCRVWLPQGDEMVVLGYGLAPEVISAKAQLTQTMRVYNALTLIKEKALQDQLIWAMATALVFILSLLSILIARSLSRRLSQPIEALIGVTKQVATGDLEIQAKVRAHDEIGQLVAAFNKMIQDLRANREKLVAAERLAAWREVARQVSHEIKNPLTPIQLALFRLRKKLGETAPAQPALQESLQSIEDELIGLRHLADEFSAFARLPKAQVQPEDLNEIIQLTTRLYDTGNDRVCFQLDLAPNLPAHALDREQVKRVLNNLIKNAVEAAQPRACNITIATRAAEDGIHLEVSDDGPGLTPEMEARLFQPNFTTKHGGSGLGLVMVKRIVEEHGGTIAVASAAGKGVLFRIRF